MRDGIRFKDEYLQRVVAGEGRLLFDGAMGTMLQRKGLIAGESPELLCIEESDAITEIHKAYVEAGSQVVTTNTFGANRLKLGSAEKVAEVFGAAIECARAAGAQYVAADMGPTGELLEPFGDLEFDEAYELFAEQARAAEEHGADLIIIETMTDLQELEAAVKAAKENSLLPIFATMSFGAGGKTFFGVSPTDAVELLEELQVEALGVNCSLGPIELAPIVDEILNTATRPVIVQANAGLPSVVNGEAVYTIEPKDYADAVRPMVEAGVSIIGGCCGTDPSYIAELAQIL